MPSVITAIVVASFSQLIGSLVCFSDLSWHIGQIRLMVFDWMESYIKYLFLSSSNLICLTLSYVIKLFVV
jgi:hypothetical protein